MYEWILLSSLFIFIFLVDDLFIDFYSLFKRLGPEPFSSKRASAAPDLPLAIMVANWKEQDVLAFMVNANSHLLFDSKVHLFLGVYPNDFETKKVALDLAERYKKIHVVVNQSEGPTYKGQMLNEIIRFIFAFERMSEIEFSGFVIHDAEDVISARSLGVYRDGLTQADFIQLPVYSLPIGFSNLVGGTYLDEFAESHSKDLLVRQSLGAAIPSAGVGTCLSRRLITRFCTENDGDLFVGKDLTEDYILGMLAYKKGMKSIFSCYYPAEDSKQRVIATREYFPSALRTSIRQKTRWTLGISLQGWKKVGWFGNAWQRYFLWRDRKALFSCVLNINALLVLISIMTWGSLELLSDPVAPTLLAANLGGMSLRLSLRIRWCYTQHGALQALLVLPRWPVAMLINTVAGLRAMGEYFHSIVFAAELTWHKTQHRFPTDLDFIETEMPTHNSRKEQEISL